MVRGQCPELHVAVEGMALFATSKRMRKTACTRLLCKVTVRLQRVPNGASCPLLGMTLCVDPLQRGKTSARAARRGIDKACVCCRPLGCPRVAGAGQAASVLCCKPSSLENQCTGPKWPLRCCLRAGKKLLLSWSAQVRVFCRAAAAAKPWQATSVQAQWCAC